MTGLAYIDLYCERTAPGLWNEPINALSNVVFLLVAGLALPVALRRPQPSLAELLLIALAAAIGVGSFLFHILANSASELADVVPIWSFVALFVLTTIYRSTGQNVARTARIAAIAAAITAVAVWLSGRDLMTDTAAGPDRLNGSLQYLPALLALGVFAALTAWRGHPARHLVLAAALVFCLALVFRTIDLQLCAVTGGIGTHFLWHLLNGVMVGLLLQVLIRHLPPVSPV